MWIRDLLQLYHFWQKYFTKSFLRTLSQTKNWFTLFSGTLGKAYGCPDDINQIASPESGLAYVDLSVAGIVQKMELPVGTYQYERTVKDKRCQFTVFIKGTTYTKGLIICCSILQRTSLAGNALWSIEGSSLHLIQNSGNVFSQLEIIYNASQK